MACQELWGNVSHERAGIEPGPTGMIRLAFLEHYTTFANMARP